MRRMLRVTDMASPIDTATSSHLTIRPICCQNIVISFDQKQHHYTAMATMQARSLVKVVHSISSHS